MKPRRSKDDVMELQSRLVEKLGELKRHKAEYEAFQVGSMRCRSVQDAGQVVRRLGGQRQTAEPTGGEAGGAETVESRIRSSAALTRLLHPPFLYTHLPSRFDPFQKRHEKKRHEKVNADKAALDVKLTEPPKRHEKVNADKAALDVKLTESGADWGKKAITKEALSRATELLQRCKPQTGPIISKKVPSWKGYSCSATERELQRYMDFETRGMCPDDWLFVQDLIFRKQCHSLPKRRCLARTAHKIVEPLAKPASLFSQSALQDASVRWNNHAFSSFASLNALSPSALASATAGTGDACGRQPGGGGCWNMSAEERRWMARPPKNTAAGGALTVKEAIAIKKGALRIGLDFNGGSGSFAAHMARHNVTMMTSAMNLEANVGRKKGLPFLETIALRGLVPLWLPYKVRLPFYDNTLDILHASNAIKFMPSPAEFEEVLFEWDRVLRVGGVMWFEEFTASAAEMPSYLSVLDLLKYRHLHWSLTPPKAMIGKPAGTVILHCLLEKPMRKDL
ncbi:unnamed protein product [Closterium sp. Yama58-4]|nr:unnamed protein product [Closterium sp. Yama58-4]